MSTINHSEIAVLIPNEAIVWGLTLLLGWGVDVTIKNGKQWVEGTTTTRGFTNGRNCVKGSALPWVWDREIDLHIVRLVIITFWRNSSFT